MILNFNNYYASYLIRKRDEVIFKSFNGLVYMAKWIKIFHINLIRFSEGQNAKIVSMYVYIYSWPSSIKDLKGCHTDLVGIMYVLS